MERTFRRLDNEAADPDERGVTDSMPRRGADGARWGELRCGVLGVVSRGVAWPRNPGGLYRADRTGVASFEVFKLDSEAELVVWLNKSESDFLTPAVEAEIDGDELDPKSSSFSTALNAVALRGKVVDRGSDASALPRSSLVSGTLDRRLEDKRVMTKRSHPPSSSSPSPLCWSITLDNIVLLAAGEVESKTSLLAERSLSRSRAIRTASLSSRLGSENLDEWPAEAPRTRRPREESRSSNSPVLANNSLDEADPALRLSINTEDHRFNYEKQNKRF